MTNTNDLTRLAEHFKGRADDCGQLARAILADRERQAGEAVAWMDDFGNVFPLGANKGAGSWLDSHKRTWRPLFASLPAPQAVQADPVDEVRFKRLSRAMDEIMRAADVYWEASSAARWRVRTELADIVKTVLSARAAAPSPDGKAEQAEAPRWLNVEAAMEDPLFQRARALMGTENWFQDNALRNVINHVLAATQPTASNAGEREAPTDEQIREAVTLVHAGNALMGKNHGDHYIRVVRKALMLAALASKPPAGEQKPVEWGSPTTVEKLIRQLQTFDPATPITSAVHTDYKGKRVALTNPLTMSRERVEGRFIRQGDESVPYSLVIWAQPDELGAQPEQVVQHVYASPIFTLAIDALNKTKAWRDCDGNDGFPHEVREQIDAVLMAYELRAARARGEKGGA